MSVSDLSIVEVDSPVREKHSSNLTHLHSHHIFIQNTEGEAPASTMIPVEGPYPHKHTAKQLFKNPDRGGFKKRIIITILTLIADVVLPVALYFILKQFIDAVWALLIAGGPALLAVIIKLIIKRELDIIGLMVFGAFGVSAVIAIVTGNARVLVFEKSIVTAVLGVVFLITLIPFRWRNFGKKKRDLRMKPFLFYISKQMLPIGKIDILSSGKEEDKIEWLWREIASFRVATRVMTAIWGIGLFIEFIGRLIMVLSPLSLDQVVLYANVFFAVVLVILFIISGIYAYYARIRVFSEVDRWLEDNHQLIVENHNKLNGTKYHHHQERVE